MNPNTKRSRARRERLKLLGLTVVGVEMTFTEKALFSRTANAMGYANVTEMLVMETMKNGKKFGITPSVINSEGKY